LRKAGLSSRDSDRGELLKQLTQYDFGWAGLNIASNTEHLEIALPNKVIEYVACGLPVLVFPHNAIRHFIEKGGVGLVGKNVHDLAEQLAYLDPSELKSNVEKCTQSVIIEDKI
jgi:glycosyltransferase involved in cell wall biosynthesis